MWKNIRSNFRNRLFSPLLRFFFDKILGKNLDNLYFPHIVFGKKIYGLYYVPTLEPEISDQIDYYPLFGLLKSVPVEFSKRDAQVLKRELRRMGRRCRCVLEIGVSRDIDTSSTGVIFENKLKETIYLGVDLLDKKYLDNLSNNIYTLKINSRRKRSIMNKLRNLGLYEIDLLIIDGSHSVQMILNDWSFSRFLSKHGTVVIHDTSVHPGPVVLYDAVDQRFFSKKKYFEHLADDWGLGIVCKR